MQTIKLAYSNNTGANGARWITINLFDFAALTALAVTLRGLTSPCLLAEVSAFDSEAVTGEMAETPEAFGSYRCGVYGLTALPTRCLAGTHARPVVVNFMTGKPPVVAMRVWRGHLTDEAGQPWSEDYTVACLQAYLLFLWHIQRAPLRGACAWMPDEKAADGFTMWPRHKVAAAAQGAVKDCGDGDLLSDWVVAQGGYFGPRATHPALCPREGYSSGSLSDDTRKLSRSIGTVCKMTEAAMSNGPDFRSSFQGQALIAFITPLYVTLGHPVQTVKGAANLKGFEAYADAAAARPYTVQ